MSTGSHNHSSDKPPQGLRMSPLLWFPDNRNRRLQGVRSGGAWYFPE